MEKSRIRDPGCLSWIRKALVITKILALNFDNFLTEETLKDWAESGGIQLGSWIRIRIRNPSYRRSLQPSKKDIWHSKKINLLTFFSILRVIVALLDPDPDS
jgi:hypothetical protein